MSMKPRVLVIVYCAALVLVGACSPGGSTDDKPKISQEAAKEQANIERAKGVVLNMLKDPSSAQFRNIKTTVSYAIPGKKVPVVCGEYNAKNEMGGYVGFKIFSWHEEKPSQITDLNLC